MKSGVFLVAFCARLKTYGALFGDKNHKAFSRFCLCGHEKSGLDFSTYGVPGLFWKTAYVRGSNIDAEFYGGEGKATEREIFNQISYVVQNGAAKDLSLRLRNSILRTNNPAWNDMNEIRVFVEYPLSIL